MDQKRDVMTMLGIRVIVAPDRSARIQLRTDYDPLPVPVEVEASTSDAGDAGQVMTRSFLNRSMAVCSVKSRLQKQNAQLHIGTLAIEFSANPLQPRT